MKRYLPDETRSNSQHMNTLSDHPKNLKDSLGELQLPKCHARCDTLEEAYILLQEPKVVSVIWERTEVRNWDTFRDALIRSAPTSVVPQGLDQKFTVQHIGPQSKTDVNTVIERMKLLEGSERAFLQAEFALLESFLRLFTKNNSVDRYIFNGSANTTAHVHPGRIFAIVNYYKSLTGILLEPARVSDRSTFNLGTMDLDADPSAPWFRPPIGAVLFMKGRSDLLKPPSLENLGCVHRSEFLETPIPARLARFAIALTANCTTAPEKIPVRKIREIVEKHRSATINGGEVALSSSWELSASKLLDRAFRRLLR